MKFVEEPVFVEDMHSLAYLLMLLVKKSLLEKPSKRLRTKLIHRNESTVNPMLCKIFGLVVLMKKRVCLEQTTDKQLKIIIMN